jgi:RNA methyltransferase, TrmH family
MLEIKSKDNPRLKHARAVRDGRESGEIFIEGLRLAEEAVAANLEITDAFFTTEFADAPRGERLLSNLADVRGANISEKLLESISDTKTPQGVVVLAKKPKTGKEVVLSPLHPFTPSPLLVVIHRLNNPTNVGAILRTAEAAGATGAILTENSADVFSPKSLRGAMGSAFRLPMWTNAKFAEAIEFCRENNIKTVCAELNAEKTHVEVDWREPKALILGSEAHGLTAEEIALTDENLKIPMHSPVESLNVAVACGIILYEAHRQR